MNPKKCNGKEIGLPKLSQIPSPAKALITLVVVVMGIALIGALGQIIVHDIIPTFFNADTDGSTDDGKNSQGIGAEEKVLSGDTGDRGDLFADMPSKDPPQKAEPLFKEEQFVWLLKWTHIHLFGMNMIFIFMGCIAILLDLGNKAKLWMVLLPFIGVLIDIGAMWMKAYITPVFFWLHIPGGGLFMAVYGIVSLKALTEMWLRPERMGEKVRDEI